MSSKRKTGEDQAHQTHRANRWHFEKRPTDVVGARSQPMVRVCSKKICCQFQVCENTTASCVWTRSLGDLIAQTCFRLSLAARRGPAGEPLCAFQTLHRIAGDVAHRAALEVDQVRGHLLQAYKHRQRYASRHRKVTFYNQTRPYSEMDYVLPRNGKAYICKVK